jgi:hypothetical protein
LRTHRAVSGRLSGVSLGCTVLVVRPQSFTRRRLKLQRRLSVDDLEYVRARLLERIARVWLRLPFDRTVRRLKASF